MDFKQLCSVSDINRAVNVSGLIVQDSTNPLDNIQLPKEKVADSKVADSAQSRGVDKEIKYVLVDSKTIANYKSMDRNNRRQFLSHLTDSQRRRFLDMAKASDSTNHMNLTPLITFAEKLHNHSLDTVQDKSLIKTVRSLVKDDYQSVVAFNSLVSKVCDEQMHQAHHDTEEPKDGDDIKPEERAPEGEIKDADSNPVPNTLEKQGEGEDSGAGDGFDNGMLNWDDISDSARDCIRIIGKAIARKVSDSFGARDRELNVAARSLAKFYNVSISRVKDALIKAHDEVNRDMFQRKVRDNFVDTLAEGIEENLNEEYQDTSLLEVFNQAIQNYANGDEQLLKDFTQAETPADIFGLLDATKEGQMGDIADLDGSEGGDPMADPMGEGPDMGDLGGLGAGSDMGGAPAGDMGAEGPNLDGPGADAFAAMGGTGDPMLDDAQQDMQDEGFDFNPDDLMMDTIDDCKKVAKAILAHKMTRAISDAIKHKVPALAKYRLYDCCEVPCCSEFTQVSPIVVPNTRDEFLSGYEPCIEQATQNICPFTCGFVKEFTQNPDETITINASSCPQVLVPVAGSCDDLVSQLNVTDQAQWPQLLTDSCVLVSDCLRVAAATNQLGYIDNNFYKQNSNSPAWVFDSKPACLGDVECSAVYPFSMNIADAQVVSIYGVKYKVK